MSYQCTPHKKNPGSASALGPHFLPAALLLRLTELHWMCYNAGTKSQLQTDEPQQTVNVTNSPFWPCIHVLFLLLADLIPSRQSYSSKISIHYVFNTCSIVSPFSPLCLTLISQRPCCTFFYAMIDSTTGFIRGHFVYVLFIVAKGFKRFSHLSGDLTTEKEYIITKK